MTEKIALLRNGKKISVEIFSKGMQIFEACFENFNLDKIKLDVWSFMLGDLSDEEFIRGIKIFCLAHTEIYPNTNIIAHIRRYAKIDPGRETAYEAWAVVLEEIDKFGSYGNPVFKNSITQKAVDAIGWKNICLSQNIGVERAHFVKAYDEISDRNFENIIRFIKNGE